MTIVEIISQYTGHMKNLGYLCCYILPGICFSFLFLDIFVMLFEKIKLSKLRKNTEKIHISTKSPEEIAALLYSMNYPKAKNSGLNSEGKAFIKGKYGTYVLDGTGTDITISCNDSMYFTKIGKWFAKHKMYRRECEANAILNWINKHIDPTSPVDSKKIYTSFKISAFLDRLPLTIALLALIGTLIFSAYFKYLHDKAMAIRSIKPEIYNTVSYNTAIENYCDNLTWDYYTAEDNTDVLNVYGKFKYAYEQANFVLQLSTDVKREWVKPYAMKVNDEPISSDAMNYIVVEMFENYINNNHEMSFSSIEELEVELLFYDPDEEEEENMDIEEPENDNETTTTTTIPPSKDKPTTVNQSEKSTKKQNEMPQGFDMELYSREVSISHMWDEMNNDFNSFLGNYVGSGIKTKAKLYLGEYSYILLYDPEYSNYYLSVSSHDGVSFDNYSTDDIVTVYGYVSDAHNGGARGQIDFVVKYIE